MHIRSEPNNAVLYIDNKFIGYTPNNYPIKENGLNKTYNFELISKDKKSIKKIFVSEKSPDDLFFKLRLPNAWEKPKNENFLNKNWYFILKAGGLATNLGLLYDNNMRAIVSPYSTYFVTDNNTILKPEDYYGVALSASVEFAPAKPRLLRFELALGAQTLGAKYRTNNNDLVAIYTSTQLYVEPSLKFCWYKNKRFIGDIKLIYNYAHLLNANLNNSLSENIDLIDNFIRGTNSYGLGLEYNISPRFFINYNILFWGNNLLKVDEQKGTAHNPIINNLFLGIRL